MKNQEKVKNQTPQNVTETTKTKAQKPVPTQQQENQRSTPQNVGDKNQKEQKVNPGIGKEHQVGDLPETGTTKNEGGDVKKIKDPDPTIPEKRNDPVGGKNDDYSRTLNTPGKTSNSTGEFTEADELDRADEDEEETSDISDEEQDEEEPGSFDPEPDHKEAFNGAKKNTSAPDERKNKNGL